MKKDAASRFPCPKCLSSKTRFDWRRADNYRLALLFALLLFWLEPFLARFDRVCKKCGNKFSP